MTARYPTPAPLAAVLAAVALAACQQLTVEQIVSRSADAMLGPGGLEQLETLRVTTVYPDHAYPVITEIRRPNLMHVEGVGRYVLVFDGERAAFLEQEPGPDGTPRGPELVDPAYARDFELDIAWVFPAYFEYPAQYLGTATIYGTPVHEIQVVLPLGIECVYALDAGTYLPLQVRAVVTVDTTTYRPQRGYGDYVTADGMTYARSFTYAWMPEDVDTATVESVEINPALAPTRFAIPPDLQ